VQFPSVIEPHCQMTAETVAEHNVVLCVGDTTFLDYGSIEAKKEGYGPIGKGGNGLILHSALAIEPEHGQSVGLLWLELPPTQKRTQRQTKLAIRFCAINLRTPYRFDNRDPLPVYATEVNCPEGETPVEWMLLTTEVVADIEMASTILRWYSYRWRVEEYHKILKSGCQVERYRLAADGMRALIGFLSVIAVELLQLTYLHRTQALAPAIEVLNPLQLRILKAKSSKLPKILTVSWAVEALAQPAAGIARLGGYLEHRHKTPIGIQVLWRGWLKLHDLCEGWQLAKET
jgi:hypothetical protein